MFPSVYLHLGNVKRTEYLSYKHFKHICWILWLLFASWIWMSQEMTVLLSFEFRICFKDWLETCFKRSNWLLLNWVWNGIKNKFLYLLTQFHDSIRSQSFQFERCGSCSYTMDAGTLLPTELQWEKVLYKFNDMAGYFQYKKCIKWPEVPEVNSH